MNFLRLIQEKILHPYFGEQELLLLLPGSAHSRYGLVKRAIQKEDLIHLRRGLYALHPRYQKKPLNLFELSFRLYGPSYVSLESALSHHGWIPEGVTTLTAVSDRRSSIFKNSLGVFSYQRVPKKKFYSGVEIKKENESTYFMARPWTALADYVYALKKEWKGIEPLLKNLRIEEHQLKKLWPTDYDLLWENYESQRVRGFLEGVRKDLKA